MVKFACCKNRHVVNEGPSDGGEHHKHLRAIKRNRFILFGILELVMDRTHDCKNAALLILVQVEDEYTAPIKFDECTAFKEGFESFKSSLQAACCATEDRYCHFVFRPYSASCPPYAPHRSPSGQSESWKMQPNCVCNWYRSTWTSANGSRISFVIGIEHVHVVRMRTTHDVRRLLWKWRSFITWDNLFKKYADRWSCTMKFRVKWLHISYLLYCSLPST